MTKISEKDPISICTMSGSEEDKTTVAVEETTAETQEATSETAPATAAESISITTPNKRPNTPTTGSTNSGSASAEFEPPLACVRRLLKNTLPSNTNVGKDASAAFSRACGIFVIYITACANDFARESKRQTITATDILAAVKELDFDEFTPQLTEFLENHRKLEKLKREQKKSEGSAGKKKRKDSIEPSDNEDDNDMPLKSMKRAKLDQAFDQVATVNEKQDGEAPAKGQDDDNKDDNNSDEL